MAASAISCSIQVLRPLIQNEVGLLWGVDKEMKKLSNTFSTILAVLDDAEIKQFQQRAIQDWLRKLKDAAYEVRDILDDCATESSRLEYEDQSCGSLRKVWTCYPVQNLLFSHNIGKRMKDVIADLDAIAQERIKFHLHERISDNFIELDERRETSSALTLPQLFGREVDKNHIIKVITADIRDVQEVSVYPIIGMGGLGKTTLAQMVLNDRKIKSHFEPIIWVYVSPDFNLKRVMKIIIESISKEILGEPSLNSLQKQVRETLSRKRYLLVLDDVWNEDQEEWDKLKAALSNGSPGACILITTRSKKVASIVRAMLTLRLSVLSEDDCWLLFRKCAFELHKEERPDLVATGKEIVKKCGGNPLAAKALGGLMRSKMEVKEWVREWRRKRWLANGFISSRGKLEVEDVGNEVCNELYKRSLFLEDDEGMSMHDPVYDLARSIIEDDFYTMEAESSSIIPKQKIRHVTLVGKGEHASAFPEALRGQGELHSILLQDRGQYIYDESEREFSCDFKNFGSLRVFDAGRAKMTQLSKSIGNSRHLTYLNLSGTTITELPASICSLHHLQTINLNNCLKLQRLPKKMHRLTGLRHLCLLGCYGIEDTPPKIGKLRQLKTLSLFVVGESDAQRLGELQHLDLGGELRITHLERVHNSTEAEEANMDGKHNLRKLYLKWGRRNDSGIHESINEQEEVIEALQPHPNIKELTIVSYGGKELPSWMSDPSVLRNVVRITIYRCRNCLGLPALWHFPSLKLLKVDGGMGSEMEYMFQIGNNVSGGGSATSATTFLSLGELEINAIPNLKGLWSMTEEEEGTVHQQQKLFPRLKKMKVRDCPQLVTLPILPAIEELFIWDSSSVTLLGSISKLTNLTSLDLYYNEDVVSFPEEMLQNLTLLQSLHIEGFRSLKVLPENMSSLVALEELSIRGCEELECLPDGGVGSPQSLLELDIGRCPKIMSLPESIQTLTQLQTLTIWHPSPELKRRCEKGKGQDWYKIAHIPHVGIYGAEP